ncbi:MAG: ligase-associated DNA damage response endonuclease PdeM [Alphaproteobacteria bacterium]|nr:ligase-associated DNA damage response endonuclease PdeM [Alphaproteobacteria bacterium]
MNDSLEISLGGEKLWLSSCRCLWWPVRETLIVSDLHIGKGIDFSVRGALLPPYDVQDTLSRLKRLIDKFKAKRVISLGDNFHRSYSFGALKEWEKKSVNDLVFSVSEWVWILGNHDPDLPVELGGTKIENMSDGYLGFYHEPNLHNKDKFQIVGHYHPKYVTRIHRQRISKPCFAWNQKTLIMPSFGSYTGGLNVAHSEILKVLSHSFYIATADTEPKPILIEQNFS